MLCPRDCVVGMSLGRIEAKSMSPSAGPSVEGLMFDLIVACQSVRGIGRWGSQQSAYQSA